jgi:hypothetical protein
MGECVFVKQVVYNKSIHRDLKIKPISECRYDERLNTKDETVRYRSVFGTHGGTVKYRKFHPGEKGVSGGGEKKTEQ